MDLSSFSYGQILFYSGLSLTLASILGLIFGIIVFFIKRRRLKEVLTDKYGF